MPHGGTPGADFRGRALGLRRYQRKGCRKTFNAATRTLLSGFHRMEKWLAFGNCLSVGMTVRTSAQHCKLAVNTSIRWRHQFLAAGGWGSRKLTGIVEAEETYVLKSRKGVEGRCKRAVGSVQDNQGRSGGSGSTVGSIQIGFSSRSMQQMLSCPWVLTLAVFQSLQRRLRLL